MNYKKYQNARDAAWQILIDCKINSLPVDIIHLCKQLNIQVREYKSVDGNDGCCLRVFGKPVILVSSNVTTARKRFTVAHELGHIILGHIGKFELVNREPSSEDNPIEHEANVFASRLLAPACVLWGCNVRTPEEIMELCNISYPAACIRAERMDLLYRRNRFLSSATEQQVFAQFSDYIQRNCL